MRVWPGMTQCGLRHLDELFARRAAARQQRPPLRDHRRGQNSAIFLLVVVVVIFVVRPCRPGDGRAKRVHACSS